jgi:hypothetical protein
VSWPSPRFLWWAGRRVGPSPTLKCRMSLSSLTDWSEVARCSKKNPWHLGEIPTCWMPFFRSISEWVLLQHFRLAAVGYTA